MKRLTLFALTVILSTSPTLRAEEKLPPDARVVRLEVQPATIALKTPFDYRQILITGQLDSGDKVDVTRIARIEAPADRVRVSPTGQVRPVADGNGELKITLGDQSLAVPVTVEGQKEPFTASFVRDVMPIMAKMGCNAGTCHGAQSGKNGFKLSLRGYDPLFDHRALTDDLAGRRFNRAAPDTSLMLLKPAGAVPHVGGVLTQPGEPYYELLRNWIADGVKLDLNSPRVTGIDIFPKGPGVPLIGMKQQVAVLATYSDGSVRDVSAEAFIESGNTEIATVDKLGLVTAVRRGEAAMLARYEGAYTATTLVVMGDRKGYQWKDVPENNYIDTLVNEKLRQVKLLPSELCSDAEFLRRVYLDLIGLPPQPDDVRAFIADNRPTREKREALIDKLIGSPDFIEHWTNKWADLLQVNRKFLGEKGAVALRDWIRKAVADDMPYDKFVHAILTGSGSTVENPPASYFKVLRDAGSVMENTTQLFLAIRFNCNKCHDHPFERWTQDQYYHLAAYFAQVGRKEDPKYRGQKIGGSAVEGATPLVEIISDGNSGEIQQIRTGQTAAPAFPFTHSDLATGTVPRREQLAHWLTSKENVYFARGYVNRLWSYLLGVGIVEPVDDIRAGNPPTNPKLLDRLTKDFVDSGFKPQHMLRTICKSRTYQLALETNRWNQDDEINYSHAIARRLPAEVLYDTVHRATGSVSKLPGLPAGARAAQLLDSNVEIPGGFFLQFGKPPRESACECERTGTLMLGPILNLINGPTIGNAIKDPENRVAKLVATEKDDGKVVEELFLAMLCRSPTAKEKEAGLKALRDAKVVAEFNRLVEENARRTQALAAYEKTLPTQQAAWEKRFKAHPTWTVLEPAEMKASGGADLARQSDGSILASGKNATPEVYTIKADSDLRAITAIRLEVLPDPSLPGMGPGRAPTGNFVLNEFRVSATPKGTGKEPTKVAFQRAIADFSQAGFAVALAIDNNPQTGWAISPQYGKSHAAIFELRRPIVFPKGATLTIELDQRFAGKQHNIGRFRLSVTSVKPPLNLIEAPEAITKILAVPAGERTNEQKAALTNYYRTIDPQLAQLRQAVAEVPAPADKRLLGAQDLVWALINSPEFLFNH